MIEPESWIPFVQQTSLLIQSEYVLWINNNTILLEVCNSLLAAHWAWEMALKAIHYRILHIFTKLKWNYSFPMSIKLNLFMLSNILTSQFHSTCHRAEFTNNFYNQSLKWTNTLLLKPEKATLIMPTCLKYFICTQNKNIIE